MEKSIRVLVVEDEIIIRLEIQNHLTNNGYEVCGAVSSGEEAIEEVQKLKPDVVLMDIRLKGDMDGIEAATVIRSKYNVPLIYLTAHSDNETLKRAKVAEPFGYILKPFNDRELVKTIEMARYRHKIETQLVEKEKWLTCTLRSIGEGVITTNRNGEITFMNPVAEKLISRSVENAIGKDVAEVYITTKEETGENLENPITAIFKSVEAQASADHKLLATHNGKTIPIEDSATPIVTDDGEIIGAVLLFQDISRRRVLESQLIQAQKLESIGQLAAGIAHEINTPTQYVGDNIRFLQESFAGISELLQKYHQLLPDLKVGNPVDELVTEIEKSEQEIDLEFLIEEAPRAIDQSLEGIGRVTKIVKAMKEFSHPSKTEKTPIDINRTIESTITVARNEWKYVAEMETHLDPELPLVPCYTDQFNQVILNIIINAAHAISEVVTDGSLVKGTIVVSTQKNGKWVEIDISDTGKGIPDEVKPKIFDPFFTTKEVGRGTGQGLTIAHDVIVNKHDGEIDFDTELGKGTTFTIRLPITE